MIFDQVASQQFVLSQLLPATANRCHECLMHATVDLSDAVASAADGHGDEIIAAQIRSVLNELAIVTGRVYTDDILDRIFSQFCIGK